MQSVYVQGQILLHTLGQAVKGINIGEVRKLSFALPGKDEQVAIALRLDELHRCLHSTDQRLEKLRALKTGLMQDLLTGKKRVTPLLESPHI